MSITNNTSGAIANVNSFVSAYNAMRKELNTDTAYNATNQTAGVFQGDATVNGMLSSLSTLLGSMSTGGAYQNLVNIGVNLQSDGTLTVDSATLATAASNGNALQTLFTANNNNPATNGFALKFAALADSALGSGGSVTNEQQGLQALLTSNQKQQSQINDQADSLQTQLRTTYSALDGQMASLNALSAYMSQQVTNWNKSSS